MLWRDEQWVAFLREGKEKENKRQQVVLNNKRGEPQYDRRQERSMGWVPTLLAIGYQFGTLNQCISAHATHTSHMFPLPFGTSLYLNLVLGSLPQTGLKR